MHIRRLLPMVLLAAAVPAAWAQNASPSPPPPPPPPAPLVPSPPVDTQHRAWTPQAGEAVPGVRGLRPIRIGTMDITATLARIRVTDGQGKELETPLGLAVRQLLALDTAARPEPEPLPALCAGGQVAEGQCEPGLLLVKGHSGQIPDSATRPVVLHYDRARWNKHDTITVYTQFLGVADPQDGRLLARLAEPVAHTIPLDLVVSHDDVDWEQKVPVQLDGKVYEFVYAFSATRAR